mmetsp:Transcript_26775/g.56926  ORF Transcript_26775/g.56926 Transcript_26775/m.56926 type:complete len:240 (+) Transcript_26775:453-1172(+)|eukprot:CAMPEP_0172555476 /NCGR_PEP_ID=MMETSP1067-20121228/58440_1 /TAXON_ID=265564 ORGANISM="Thalassiosira punctigera, Strain Tpunct2005C2" /NCGR_SAMPLE_ID=MMETSP1067 /ASSEMBLY_ACC=CAM_ASM_000444 /LENGTH=239 /DNA_ID=CAMNT_0013343999 /DNA_START=440 /DNA_END=1159 /DNA_ORIENTATION=-
MALVNVVNMAVLDNPAPFLSPFSFEITFECLQPLDDDLEWKVLYVGSAEDTSHDQVLDEILVGPVPVGINKFVLQADAPDTSQIPEGDILGVTVVLVTCSYREKEFVRVGYYVNNEYSEQYDEEVGPPRPLDMDKVRRAVLSEKPRVTRFAIPWGDKEEEGQTSSQQENQQQQIQGQSLHGQSMEGQMMEDVKGMTLEEMGGGDADIVDEDEDDISVEGKDMMMEDVMMGNLVAASAME